MGEALELGYSHWRQAGRTVQQYGLRRGISGQVPAAELKVRVPLQGCWHFRELLSGKLVHDTR